MLPVDKGARTQVRVAIDPNLDRASAGGKFFSEENEAKPAKTALDATAASRLWAASEELTGVTFDPVAAAEAVAGGRAT